jgi:hypothetical protein
MCALKRSGKHEERRRVGEKSAGMADESAAVRCAQILANVANV